MSCLLLVMYSKCPLAQFSCRPCNLLASDSLSDTSCMVLRHRVTAYPVRHRVANLYVQILVKS